MKNKEINRNSFYPAISFGMLIQNKFVWQHVFEVPLKALTLQLPSKLLSLANIANIYRKQISSMHVEEFLVFIHPDFDNTSRVDTVCVLITGESVRVEGAENVTHSRTRYRLQAAAAHPNSE